MVGPIFLDTSVFVGGLVDFGPSSEPPRRVLAAAVGGRLSRPRTAWHCCLEFYSVTTRLPEEYRLEPAEAYRLLENTFAAFRIFDLPPGDRRAFFRRLAEEGIGGSRTYDAHIAEIARRSHSRIVVTDNRRDFATLARFGIEVLTAAEFAARL